MNRGWSPNRWSHCRCKQGVYSISVSAWTAETSALVYRQVTIQICDPMSSHARLIHRCKSTVHNSILSNVQTTLFWGIGTVLWPGVVAKISNSTTQRKDTFLRDIFSFWSTRLIVDSDTSTSYLSTRKSTISERYEWGSSSRNARRA